ncbi:hypothetical protein V6Z12_A06G199400 [Gossypium hirsutum]
MKVSKLTTMDVGNCFQLHASLVFIAIITFTSNVQRHPFTFLITLSIPSTNGMKCLDELPTKINHPSHHIHPLFLNYSNDDSFCKLCQKKHSGPFYGCSLCHFNINLECTLLKSIVKDKRSHQHPFSLLWRQGSFICDVCDIEGNYISYICLKCCIVVHKKCTSLPRIIKFSRHDHCIFNKYFLETQVLTKQYCKICFKEVKLKRGSYSCGKLSCNYVVHVNCVLEDGYLYEIEHFHRQHCLVLADKMEEEIDRKCDGCMLSISTLFYYCSECPFFLHKTCTELPKIKTHWFHQWKATLNFEGFKKCEFCMRYCSGFFYNIGGAWKMCIRYAKVADIIEYEGHQHFLFYDFKCKEKCNSCGADNDYGAFRCGKCKFALDFGCLILPYLAIHKIDEHMLKLTYDDDKEQSYCDICEQKREPSLWYYSCSICGASAHPKCFLGQFPFLKDGSP